MTEVSLDAVSDQRVDVGDGVSIAASWDAVLLGDHRSAGAVRVHVQFDPRFRRSVAASVQVDRAGEGDEVTAVALREVRVQAIVAASALRVVTVTRGAGGALPLGDYLARVKASVERNAANVVAEAVVLYRIASVVNLPPLKFVADTLDVSVSTATRMMAKARQQGLALDLVTRETYNRPRDGSA